MRLQRPQHFGIAVCGSSFAAVRFIMGMLAAIFCGSSMRTRALVLRIRGDGSTMINVCSCSVTRSGMRGTAHVTHGRNFPLQLAIAPRRRRWRREGGVSVGGAVFMGRTFTSTREGTRSCQRRFVVPRRLLDTVVRRRPFVRALRSAFCGCIRLDVSLRGCLARRISAIPSGIRCRLKLSIRLDSLLRRTCAIARCSDTRRLSIPRLVRNLLRLRSS